MDWQPIETAPKDGTLVDLWIPAEVGGFEAPAHRAPDYSWDKDREEWLLGGEFSMPLVDTATHWMPIPAGPDSQTNGDSASAGRVREEGKP